MKKVFIALSVLFLATAADAQFSKASLQASGLTCSMCSKAVKVALEGVPFVEKVDVNLKSQEYDLQFKKDAVVDFDMLSAAVVDAGFSVAQLKATAELSNVKALKDGHVLIGNSYFHFLNGKGQPLNGATTFSLVDKSFVSAKDFKKYSTASKMKCVQTGKAEACCTEQNIAESSRIYHVII